MKVTPTISDQEKLDQASATTRSLVPPSPGQLAACLPARFRCMVRAKIRLQLHEMKRLGTHLEAIDDPATSEEARLRHVRTIYESGNYLQIAGNWDDFLQRVLSWSKGQVDGFKQREGIGVAPIKPPSASTTEPAPSPIALPVRSADGVTSPNTQQDEPPTSGQASAVKVDADVTDTIGAGPQPHPGKGEEPPVLAQSGKGGNTRRLKRVAKPCDAAELNDREAAATPLQSSERQPLGTSGAQLEEASTTASKPSPSAAAHEDVAGLLKASQGEMEIVELELTRIRIRKDLRGRNGYSRKTAEEYAEGMRAGTRFPPIELFKLEGEYVLVDGFHRLKAATLLGRKTIHAKVHSGDEDDALLFAVSANNKHGRPLTLADRRHNAMLLLNRHPKWSDRMIAEKVSSSHTSVSTWRNQLANLASSISRLGKDGKTRKVASTPPDTQETPAPAGSNVKESVMTDNPPPADPFDPDERWKTVERYLTQESQVWPPKLRHHLGDWLCTFAEEKLPRPANSASNPA